MRQIFTVGETIYDIIFKDGEIETGKVGGSVVNSAISIARTGLNITLISDWGDDNLGDIITSFLTAEGVDCSFVDRKSNPRTPIALAHLNKNGDASYTFYRDGAPISPNNIPDITCDDIVLFSSMYALEESKRENLLAVLKRAKSVGALIYYDPNVRDKTKVDFYRERYLENISYADIVRGSDDDFEALFSTTSLEHIAKLLNNKALVCTVRSGMNRFLGYGVSAEAATQKVKVASTVGAGDNFNAGFIASLGYKGVTRASIGNISQETVSEAIANGVDFASRVCEIFENYVQKDFAREFSKRTV